MLSNNTLELFKRASNEIKAYKDFLSLHGINPEHINSIEDLYSLPMTSKKNYLIPNKLKDLVWPADLNGNLEFCSTSGSTGEPYYFPRNDDLARQYSLLVESFLKCSSYGYGRTLFINGFGMGVWIGGILTHRAFEIASARTKMPVALLPTGYNKTEVFKALIKLAPNFEQIIIAGYPPFIKEVIDEAPANGLDLSKMNMRFLFAAEAFTEKFRDYVCNRAFIQNPILDTLNIYGTADIGAMAYETPLSILIRRLAINKPQLYKNLFGQIEKTPTLAQYNPDFIDFEEVEGKIVISAQGAMPLIRYSVGDNGGVLSYDSIDRNMRKNNIELDKEIKTAGLEHTANIKFPFVFVYERIDLSATLHGVLIYPEFIKECLLKAGMAKLFTERFTMITRNNAQLNQFLEINLELQKGTDLQPGFEALAHSAIIDSLSYKSSEFMEISKNRATNNLIKIVIWSNGHPRYFTPNTKQKWVEK
jgi:phenylacetate-CoA ligase